MNISFVPGLRFPKQPWPFIKTKGKLWVFCTYSSHGNLQAQDIFTGPDITYLQSLQVWKGTFLLNAILWFNFRWKIKWKMAKSCKHLSPFLGYTLSFQDFFKRWVMTGSDAGFVPRKITWIWITAFQRDFSELQSCFIPLCCGTRPLLPSPCLSFCGYEVWPCPDPWRRSQECS